ncbi:MAG: hypothetical protein IKW37_06940, partial [Bacteroidaceae bacterium]|nr:hypothetical protein [Bacteroidaceae bacterium]
KRTRFAQTAFRSSRKILDFSSRSSTEAGEALPGGHIASLVVWMYTRSFTTLRSILDDKKTSEAKKEKHHTPTSEAMLHKKNTKVRPHFFAVKRRCFSEREKQKAV